ncbi:Beta-glucosidase 31 [Platanthera zijinensis]|uniref:Beta-glucosidase 31 n=1 Tax=Platanthera zijinensis TaxID=2320716 RepID=A0AAP0AWI7_9ASPA
MERRLLPFLLVFVLTAIAGVAASITRDDFPPDFIFGAGTSAYQVEGAAAEDGRKPSIWDTYAHSGRTRDKKTADITADQYHHYKEDVKLMKKLCLDAYRFSISWSRLIPDGRGRINPKGLQYYNNLINELIINGIQPHVTLHHFDHPQALEDEYGGLVSPKMIEDFTAYADLCFKEFGDRVKYWSTFNEPNVEAILGYDVALFPPGRCSSPFGSNCSAGDSRTEPYISAHNILLAHASAATLYKEKYQKEQRGQIGITIIGFWFEPSTNATDDVAAVKRTMEFHIGWFLQPLVYGDYPATMKDIVKSRLPIFSKEESSRLKASFDFIGLNHYNVLYLQSNPTKFDYNERDYFRDLSIKLGDHHMEGLLKVKASPWGLQRILEYIKANYRNPPIIIHENGYSTHGANSTAPGYDFNDHERVNYIKEYIESLHTSIRNGSNTFGYFIWSFIDCFELVFGYTSKFGLYGVDFSKKERPRYPHLSAQWYSNFLRCGGRETGSINLYTYIE